MTESNIKDYVNDDIFSVLNSFVSKIEDKLMRDIFVGTVVEHDEYEIGDDGTPSPTVGKCRIMVYGVYDAIPIANLPWSLPDQHWVGSEAGSFVVPPVGTLVRVTFDNDNIYRPIYSNKLLQAGKIDTNIEKNYPNNMITFSTDAGSTTQHDRTTGEEIKTNMVGSFTPETIKINTSDTGETSVITDEASELIDDGIVVETINGAADSIADSFYNKKMTVNNDGSGVATNEININKKNGSLTYEHIINNNKYLFTLDEDVLTIVHTTDSGDETVILNSEGITVTDHSKNEIKLSPTGIDIESPKTINIVATAINIDGTPGSIEIVKGTIASPEAGLPCGIPFCLFNGTKHDTKFM